MLDIRIRFQTVGIPTYTYISIGENFLDDLQNFQVSSKCQCHLTRIDILNTVLTTINPTHPSLFILSIFRS